MIGSSAGAVFMYTQTAGVWSQQQAITPGLRSYSAFGSSVAFDGAGILAVGAAGYSKSVYIYLCINVYIYILFLYYF